jgi:hypothetical protein
MAKPCPLGDLIKINLRGPALSYPCRSFTPGPHLSGEMMARNWTTLTAFDRDTLQTACELIRDHGKNATVQAFRRTDERVAQRDLTGVLACVLVAEAVKLMLKERPEAGECIH